MSAEITSPIIETPPLLIGLKLRECIVDLLEGRRRLGEVLFILAAPRPKSDWDKVVGSFSLYPEMKDRMDQVDSIFGGLAESGKFRMPPRPYGRMTRVNVGENMGPWITGNEIDQFLDLNRLNLNFASGFRSILDEAMKGILI